MGKLRKRLSKKSIWKKIFLQRLTEPAHLNALALVVYLFGSFKQKVAYDLILRPHNAFGILNAAQQAKKLGFKKISIIEFGVANGAGLMNMIKISERVTKTTGIGIDIYGFDSGEGMPEPVDYRDHPEYYSKGDFPMNMELLDYSIGTKAKLVIGNIENTLSDFLNGLGSDSPVGYVVVDVDYYSSTKQVLDLFKAKADLFLPRVNVYFDDIFMPNHNSKCGELLAIEEFNSGEKMRVLEHHKFFQNERIFKNPNWIKQLYYCHILDHDYRSRLDRNRDKHVLDNPYLDFEGNKNQFS